MTLTPTQPMRMPVDQDAAAAVARGIAEGGLEDVELLWPDHQGHPRGKRIEAGDFLARATGQGFGFCDAALAWDVEGDVKPGLRVSDWDTGYPDMFAIPDLATFTTLPWRARTGQVVCDLVDHHDALVRTAPRTVLRRVVARLAALGYEARVGVEIEFHLLDRAGHAAQRRRAVLLAPEARRARPGDRRHPARPARLRGPRGDEHGVRTGPGRGQPEPRAAARRRRPGCPLQVRDAPAGASRGRGGDLHGQAVRPVLAQLDARAPRCGATGNRPSRRPTGPRTSCTVRRSAACCPTCRA